MDENFQNMNETNEIYNDLKNNPNPKYIPPQMTNGQYFNSRSNNIYSVVQSNNTPQTNIYSQNSRNIYYQDNININTQPQNNHDIYNDQSNENYNPPPPIYSPQSNGYFNPGYTPHTNEIKQISIPRFIIETNPVYSPHIASEKNNGFTSQTNDDNIASTKINITPVNIDNSSLPNTSKPLVHVVKKNKVKNVENCCSRRDPSLREVTGCQKGWIIAFCIFLDILGFNEIGIASLMDSINYGLALLINLLNIAFTIMESVSTLRIRWIRIFGSILSVVYLLGTISVYIIQRIQMDNSEDQKEKDNQESFELENVLKIIILIIIMNIVFYAYWGIRICYCENLERSSGQSNRTRRRRRRHP